jgi:hypothetical protein
MSPRRTGLTLLIASGKRDGAVASGINVFGHQENDERVLGEGGPADESRRIPILD